MIAGAHRPYCNAVRTDRRVWAVVTRHPHASLDELVGILGMPRSTVRDALRRLRAVGHIDFADGARRARTILVPFVITRNQ